MLTDPQKLLDIGVGFGKYGVLAREYLELWNSGNEYHGWSRQIDGIEAFEEYLTPLHEQVYSRMYKGDALTILPVLKDRYDLILLIDVLEHFTYNDGMKVLGECLKHGRNLVISVPKVMSEQGEMYGNPFETHRFNWKEKDLAFLPEKFFLKNDRSTICFAGEDAERIHGQIRSAARRRCLARIASFLHIKKILKNILGSRY
jgi:hypothetical protein